MNKHYKKLPFALLMALVAGCSPKEDEAPGTSGPAPAPQTEAVSISQTTEAAPPPPGGLVAPTASAAIDITQAERPKNAQGDAMNDLEYLNHLVAQMNEFRINPQEIQQKAFKTEAEQLAYEEAQQKAKAPVRDINELVTAGVLKALPQAPGGQKYAIDPTTGKVVLQ